MSTPLDADPARTTGTTPAHPVWRISDGLVAYETAVSQMQRLAAEIHNRNTPETVWLLEHPPLYTAGTSASAADLLQPDRFPVHRSGRGGEFTYHGPGQRVAYVMLDLKRRHPDVRAYVHGLEDWLIAALDRLGVEGERRDGRVGIWVRRTDRGEKRREDKIAAIGVRIRRWVTFHGVSLNVEPELDHYEGIVPCGISGHGVTSLVDLGIAVSMAEVDSALKATFDQVFGPGAALGPTIVPGQR